MAGISEHRGNIQPYLDLEEHDGDNNAKRVNVVAGGTGQATVVVQNMASAATLYAVVNTAAVGVQNSLTTLLAGPNQIGSVTVSNPVSIAGNITLADSKTYIGLVSVSGTVAATIGGVGSFDSFGHLIIADINNDIDVQFYRATSDSDLSNIITETESNGGTVSKSNGMATFATTTAASSRAKGVSLQPSVYTAGAEVYMIFTAGFTGAGSGTSYHRIGLYNDYTDGFYIGYEAGTFGVSVLKGGSATQTPKASFSVDTLVGGATSKYTRNGTPEAIDLTKLNVWRIRFGWVGSAPIYFEVLSPDGNWVTFHKILQPNLVAVPSLNTADLYATCDVNAGNSSTALSIITNCWGAGTTQKLRKLSDTLTNSTLAGLTRAVITGVTTGGGGGYVNVKVNPSGALTADVTATDLDIRNLTATDVVTANLSAGANYIGLTSTVLGAGNQQIGSVTVSNPISITGNITLSNAKTYIGLVTNTPVGLHTVIQAGNTTVTHAGLITLAPSPNYIGLTTAVVVSSNVTVYNAPYSYWNQSSLISGYIYHGRALPGSNPTQAAFRIERESLRTGEVVFGGAAATFVHQWSAASLASLTYL